MTTATESMKVFGSMDIAIDMVDVSLFKLGTSMRERIMRIFDMAQAHIIGKMADNFLAPIIVMNGKVKASLSTQMVTHTLGILSEVSVVEMEHLHFTIRPASIREHGNRACTTDMEF